MRFDMHSSSLKSAIAAATVAAIFAVAPLFGFPQAMAASRGGNGGHVGGNNAVGHVAGGFAGTRSPATPHQDIAQGAGNPSNAASSGLYNSHQ
jgi:hypothetical protein